MPPHVSSTCAHHQEVKIALHSLWYHHTYRWPSRAPVHETATYRCDDMMILRCTVSKTSKVLKLLQIAFFLDVRTM